MQSRNLLISIFVCYLCTCFSRTSEIGHAHDHLQALTKFRQQHHRTIDGRLCATAFVQNKFCKDRVNSDVVSSYYLLFLDLLIAGKHTQVAQMQVILQANRGDNGVMLKHRRVMTLAMQCRCCGLCVCLSFWTQALCFLHGITVVEFDLLEKLNSFVQICMHAHRCIVLLLLICMMSIHHG